MFIIGHSRKGSGRAVFPVGGADGETDIPIKQVAHRKGFATNSRTYSPDGITGTLDTAGGGGRELHVAIQPVLTPDRIEKRQNGRRFKEDGEPMFTLTAQDRHGIAIREATKKGCSKTSGVNQGEVINPLKDKTNNGWHFEQQVYDPSGITRAVKAGGGSGNIPKTILPKEEQGFALGVGHHPLSKKREFNGYGNLSPTLIATDYKAPKTALMSDFRIRKLTPLECFRLQGFTDEQFYKAKNDGVSNSQLYKQAGNSVTVNVIDAIARRLT